jgi:hypothetical protein
VTYTSKGRKRFIGDAHKSYMKLMNRRLKEKLIIVHSSKFTLSQKFCKIKHDAKTNLGLSYITDDSETLART